MKRSGYCLCVLVVVAALCGCHKAEPRGSDSQLVDNDTPRQSSPSWIDAFRNLVVKNENGRVELEPPASNSFLPTTFKSVTAAIANHELKISLSATLDFTLDGDLLRSDPSWVSATQPSAITSLGSMFDALLEECFARIPILNIPDVLEYASLRPDAPAAIEVIAASMREQRQIAIQINFADGSSRGGIFQLTDTAVEKLGRIVRHEKPNDARRDELERANWSNKIQFEYLPRQPDAGTSTNKREQDAAFSGILNVNPSPPAPATRPHAGPSSGPLRND